MTTWIELAVIALSKRNWTHKISAIQCHSCRSNTIHLLAVESKGQLPETEQPQKEKGESLVRVDRGKNFCCAVALYNNFLTVLK